MALITFKAGDFIVEADSDLYPIWVKIKRCDDDTIGRFRHSEIRDLSYCLERMSVALRAALPGDKKHELN